MKEEILRKSVHLSSLAYPIIYFLFLTKMEMILLISAITLFVILGDLVRVKSKWLNNIFHIILRDGEKNGGLSGATFFMMGTLLTVLIFNKNIAILSLFILVISDTSAAIFGKMIKSKKILGDKSLAGSSAFFISSIMITLFAFYIFGWAYNLIHIIIPCFVTMVAELFAKKIYVDDNILIPITFGLSANLVLFLI